MIGSFDRSNDVLQYGNRFSMLYHSRKTSKHVYLKQTLSWFIYNIRYWLKKLQRSGNNVKICLTFWCSARLCQTADWLKNDLFLKQTNMMMMMMAIMMAICEWNGRSIYCISLSHLANSISERCTLKFNMQHLCDRRRHGVDCRLTSFRQGSLTARRR